MKKDSSVAFNAQILLDICKSKNIHSCAVVTSLKKNKSVYNLSKKLVDEINSLGENALFCDKIDSLDLEEESSLKIYFAPNPNRDSLSYNFCKLSDAVVFIEKYGYSNHYEFEDMIGFLRKRDIEILGVWGLR